MPALQARRWKERACLTLALALALPGHLRAQEPVPPDSARADSAVVLPALRVNSTGRTDRVPIAVGRLDRAEIAESRPTVTLDEALLDIPGVFVANRYTFALDERVAIRGFGSRAAFGVRGIKILVDGIPQTLPDGQSQLTNLELGDVASVEVLRGSASSRHGNASGGILAFRSLPPAGAPFAQSVRIQGGSFDTFKWQSRTSARTSDGNLAGTLSISRLTTDGPRQHSRADLRKLNARATWFLSERTSLTMQAGLADVPEAQNPGALTVDEYEANPDSAGINSVSRNARKDVAQQQAALTLRHVAPEGSFALSVFGLHRSLLNPIATNTVIDLDRWAGGGRLDLGRRWGPVTASAGVDLQSMRDDRRNFLGDGSGQPSDSVQVNEIETVTEIGPFLHVAWDAGPRIGVAAGIRYDAVTFDIDDRHVSDGADQSGRRRMSAWSWHAGLTALIGPVVTYANVASSFQTPTTTELINQPSGSGGVNPGLDPERAVTVEVGARGRFWAAAGDFDIALFQTTIRDAIVPFEEIGGRSFFQNAGRTRHRGVEAKISVVPRPELRLSAAYTLSSYQFLEYRLVEQAAVDTLDGNRLPGIPRHVLRLGARARPARGMTIEIDHTLVSGLFADDANTLEVDGWGGGVTNLRVRVERPLGDLVIAPFVGVNNAFDRRYVGSVTINGFGGRVLEPAPGRNVYLGAEISWRMR